LKLEIGGVPTRFVEGGVMELRKKTDEEIHLLLEENELEYNEIRNSNRDTYYISWKLDNIRGELLRRKLKLDGKKAGELVSMTQDSLRVIEKLHNDWDRIKKGADQTTLEQYRKLEQEERDLQTAIHLQMNGST
jgi:hypothetical protein